MTRERWADGPEDDHDAEAFERAREVVMRDEDASAERAAKVRAEFDSEINEICAGAWSVEGAKAIAERMCIAAEREIDKLASLQMTTWAEMRACKDEYEEER